MFWWIEQGGPSCKQVWCFMVLSTVNSVVLSCSRMYSHKYFNQSVNQSINRLIFICTVGKCHAPKISDLQARKALWMQRVVGFRICVELHCDTERIETWITAPPAGCFSSVMTSYGWNINGRCEHAQSALALAIVSFILSSLLINTSYKF